ncbi:hypothetical protein BV22DRAFT_1073169 [Leucogyrophana mollusca]|uniref:Uncharacterized protein n=1 Tax=Leucogyrophana mollusca TaxID=85980 RepID=A0ACB8B7R4_9AGAM|nr:hypothetical protein BV22DRAFT_1073169 [Leucogyrophana mollusca]
MPWNDVLPRRLPLVSSLNSHKVLLYTLVSTIAVSATIANALKSRSNFYAVAIYLAKSNRSVLILANFGVLIALLCGQVAQRIFFGPLRPQEIERLYDRLWFFVTESLLAFTIFRDDFDIPFAMMFGFLLFVKSFHWLASDRVEWMDQRPYPGPPTLFHIRMTTLFSILWCIDLFMFAFAVEGTMKNGVGGMMMFASEYAILMASAMNISAKYLVCVVDLRRARQRGGENAPPWQNKSMWVFYIELATDFLKLATYLLFFMLIVAFYGLPLNIIRDVYLTGRSFVTRLRALIRYRAATRNMDERYPDATEGEMTAMTDHTCIICREEMVLHGSPSENAETQNTTQASDGPNTTPKKLPCGHIFHFYCLRSWLERQQSCPTCRRSVLEDTPREQRQGAPAPPQPGAVPRPQNPFGNAGAQVGQQNRQELNNRLGGMFGRLVGNAAQPPLVPGQLPNGPVPPVPQNPGNLPAQNFAAQGWIPGQVPGVVIQYNIQYQGEHQADQTPPPQPPQPPQPVPHFAGFVGPDDDWHPWGMDRRWFALPFPRNPPRPTPTVPTPPAGENDTQTARSDSLSPTEELPSPDGGPLNPREAAAQAALRRFGGAASEKRVRFSGSTEGPAHGASGAGSSRSANATTPTSTLKRPSAFAGPNSSVNGTTSAPGFIPVPTLIPYDELHPAALSLSASQVPSRQKREPSPHQQQTSRASSPAPSSQAPLSHLPPIVTDTQLAVMDQLTREAIDERLRVLEGVSNAVYRCLEDLTRVRSALPDPTSSPPVSPRESKGPSAPNPAPPQPDDVRTSMLSLASRTLDSTNSGTGDVERRDVEEGSASGSSDGHGFE